MFRFVLSVSVLVFFCHKVCVFFAKLHIAECDMRRKSTKYKNHCRRVDIIKFLLFLFFFLENQWMPFPLISNQSSTYHTLYSHHKIATNNIRNLRFCGAHLFTSPFLSFACDTFKCGCVLIKHLLHSQIVCAYLTHHRSNAMIAIVRILINSFSISTWTLFFFGFVI